MGSKPSKETTKYCPDCGSEHLGCLETYRKKVCVDCGKDPIPWFLAKGQKGRYSDIRGE